ncbi:MAG: S-adenosylmethionine:tRNA ribosyltransferase-isomerase [Actinomycetota bacterium]
MNSTTEGNLAPELAAQRPATEPPEARGLRRDEVRLLVARRDRLTHTTFDRIGDHLEAGDLLVVNTSATLPAAIDARRGDNDIVVHFSARLDDDRWAIELRAPDRSGPLLDGRRGEVITLDGGAVIEVLSTTGIEGRSRIVEAGVDVAGGIEDHLARHGRPISYSYVTETWPLSMYQTVFAREPGSAEMPSAARPFTAELVTTLISRGVVFAPVLLHAGVSSLEGGEVPLPERFRVPAPTARLVNQTRAAGGRVIAVGTTVTRALESAGDRDGVVRAADGWTDLVLGGERGAFVVDGLVTGWHPAQATHQALLRAVAGPEMVTAAYDAATKDRYLWHEFGDSCLLLP